jgi:long-chain acyl-CoA synthetase
MLIWNSLKQRAAAHPGKPALACNAKTLTYAEFLADAGRLARLWLSRGLQPGDRIALHLRNGLEFATCYYACLAAGLIAVSINNRLTPEEIAWVLEHSGSRAYVSQPELRISSSLPSWEFDTGAAEVVLELAEQDPDAPALILYTSGTTAKPKGVIHTHRTLAGNASYLASFGITADDHTLLFTSMAHASGGIMQFINALFLGGTVTLVPVFDAAIVLDAWATSGATFFMALPTLVRPMLAEQRERPRNVTGRVAICGGDNVPVALQQEFEAVFGFPLVEGFGMTEGLPTLANRLDANCPGSMGRPMGDIQVRVVEGELWMRGAGITIGYWRDVQLEDGWLKTGDLVEVDADGFVWFRGRRKEIIIRGGSNISPQEVEETLYRHPAVAEAGVIGEADTYWGEVVIAYVALRDGHAASAEEVIFFARTHLAEYKCPTKVLFLPVLPKGITGKVQRRVLKDLHTQAAQRAIA